MSLLGGTGLRKLAKINHARARSLRDALAGVPGLDIVTPRFFNEFAVRLPKPAAEVVDALVAHGVIAGVPFSRLDASGDKDLLLVCATETTTAEDIAAFASRLAEEIA